MIYNYFFSPLEQFDISFTVTNFASIYNFMFTSTRLSPAEELNCAFFLFLDSIIYNFYINDLYLMACRVLIIYLIITFLAYNQNIILSNYWMLLFQDIYIFLASAFKEQVLYRGQKYFPLLATLFFFIVTINLMGMLPYEGALASQAVISLSLSFFIFLVLTLIGFVRQKFKFLLLFIPPKGIPLLLIPLLIIIEIISYLSRGISLGVRLFANIMAGHTLLFIFSSFILNLNGFLGFGVFIVIVLITGLEFMIVLLQAYVFFVLTLIYFRDSIEVSH
jgi:F-type H+-transporting ATPase subunit a